MVYFIGLNFVEEKSKGVLKFWRNVTGGNALTK